MHFRAVQLDYPISATPPMLYMPSFSMPLPRVFGLNNLQSPFQEPPVKDISQACHLPWDICYLFRLSPRPDME